MARALRGTEKRLQLEVVRLEKEKNQYLKALYALTREELDFDFDKEELLSQVVKGQSLQELIAELERST